MKVKGLVLKRGGGLAMNISINQSMEVVSPKNHTFQLGVIPVDAAQQLHLAVSAADEFAKQWGVAVVK